MGWRIDPQQTALLVIDVQERLVPAIADAATLVRRVATAAAAARLFDLPIFLTEQAPEKIGHTHPRILEASGVSAAAIRMLSAFSKAGCFPPGELPANLLIAGIETHVCIRQTVYDLRERGHHVWVLADAVGSRSPLDHRLALHELRETAGARVSTVETVFWEMLGQTGGERFKRFLALIK